MFALIMWLGCVVIVLTPPILIGCILIEGLKDDVKYALAMFTMSAYLLLSVMYIRSELLKFAN